MSSPEEILHILDFALDVAWWLFFPPLLVAGFFAAATLFSHYRK